MIKRITATLYTGFQGFVRGLGYLYLAARQFDMRNLRSQHWIGIIVIFLLSLVISLVFYATEEQKKFDQYVIEHECVRTGNISPRSPLFTCIDGVCNSVPQPDKVQWSCDDGRELIWR